MQKKHVLMYYAHVKRLHSVKWQSLYGDTATIENVDKFCMKEKKSRRKLSLHRVWDMTASLTAVSRSTAQKIVEEKKKAQDEQQQPKQPAQTEHWLHWQQGSCSQTSPSNEVCLHTLFGESKSADGETTCSPQQDQIPSQGQGIDRCRLHSRLYMMITPRQTEDKI